MDFSGTVKHRKNVQMGQKLPALQVVQCVFHNGSPLMLYLKKKKQTQIIFFDKSIETPQVYLSFTLRTTQNHTELDLRMAFHWLWKSISWLKDNVNSHCPGTVLGWFISLLSSLCLSLVLKKDTWLLPVTMPFDILVILLMPCESLLCILLHDRLSPLFALFCKTKIKKKNYLW